MSRRACDEVAKSETHGSRCSGGESDGLGACRGWRWNEETGRRRKWGDLGSEVTVPRSQSPHGTARRLRHTLGRRYCGTAGKLGRVDELFDDDPCGHEMNECQKGLAQFLIPRGNASKLFEVIKEPFDLLP